jgi:diaminohydroxyphosphoribosylaminopyrimidine deaminase/5-amino-6-(5-phosphoribosylamino)uracil reductase
VLVDAEGKVIGEGFHTYQGVKHAEILALEQAGDRARGAILYINLEPCCHQGRTGPCTEALVCSGVARVVASMPDPNPQVSGRGFARLREAGIEVTSGILEEEARAVNDAFAKYIRHHLPLVTLKAAMTLDGKIAPPPDGVATGSLGRAGGPAGGWITSERARAHVHELRHRHDAILVGVGTVIADNPLLTDRSGLARRRPLVRVVLDSHLRLPLESRLAETAEDDVLVFCCFAENQRKQQLEEHGIQVEQVSPASADGRPDLATVCRRLAEREITSVMIEGGATVNWTALDSRVADKVFFYYSPRILSGTDSVPFAAGRGFPRMGEAAHLKWFRLDRLGEDFLVEGYLRDPYLD